jgi:bis(5'-nucleosidyl)-tetraphosphatase
MTHTSYGIIAYCKEGSEILFLIVKNVNGGHWSFPKGTPEGSETPIETAIREFEEETGMPAPPISGEPILKEEYDYTNKVGGTNHKINKYFMAEIERREGKKPMSDIAETSWRSFEDAKKIIYHKEATETLEKAKELLA